MNEKILQNLEESLQKLKDFEITIKDEIKKYWIELINKKSGIILQNKLNLLENIFIIFFSFIIINIIYIINIYYIISFLLII